MEGFEIYNTVTCIHDHVEHKGMAACKDLKESAVHHGKHQKCQGCTNARFRVLCSGLVEILGQLGPENEDTMILLKHQLTA